MRRKICAVLETHVASHVHHQLRQQNSEGGDGDGDGDDDGSSPHVGVDESDGRRFVCRLRRFAGQHPSPEVGPSDEAERAELWALLDDVREHPARYRQFQARAEPHTVVAKDKLGVSYKLDSVAAVDVADPTPKVDLRYLVDGHVHGIVVLYLKPRLAPPLYRNVLVDDVEVTNFPPGVVMSFVDAGMRDSVATRCVNEIEWEVEEQQQQVGGVPEAVVVDDASSSSQQ